MTKGALPRAEASSAIQLPEGFVLGTSSVSLRVAIQLVLGLLLVVVLLITGAGPPV